MAEKSLAELEAQFRTNQLTMDIRLQEAQMKALSRSLALDASSRSFGSAGPQEVMEGLYAPEDYIDVMDYRRDNYGYQAYAATFTTKTDRQDGRNWPYWVSEPELAAIRGTVRLLAAYNKTVFGVLNKLRNYVVGKGFTRKVTSKRGASKQLLKAITTVLDEFDERNRITSDLDQEAVIRDIREGEVSPGLWHRGDGCVDLRIVEPDQISEPTNKGDLEEWLRTEYQMENTGEDGLPFESNWSFGVHSTKGDVGSVHGYYVQWDSDPTHWDYMPGGNQPCYPPGCGMNTWLELRKSNTDRNIKRGVSDFWPVTGDVELARKLIRNLSHAGALQAAIAWIREMAPGVTQSQVLSNTMSSADWSTRTSTQNGGQRISYQNTYQPGTTLQLGSNQKFVAPPWMNTGAASGLIQIFEGMLRSIAQIWSMPEHMITGSAANNNYASILEAGSPFVKEIETRQHWHCNMWKTIYWKVIWFNWKIGKFGSIPWKDIRYAVDIEVVGPQVDVRNKLEDTQRNILLVNGGLMSPVTAAAAEGLDYEEQVREGAKPQVSNIGFGSQVTNDGVDGRVHPQVSTDLTSNVSTQQQVQTSSELVLNGAQIQATISIVTSVADGQMPRDAGIGQLQVLFNLSQAQAEAIMGSAGTPNFKPAVPEPASTTASKVSTTMESEEGSEGHWVTLDNGAHVFIEGGEITKGPKGFIGKTKEEVSKSVAKKGKSTSGEKAGKKVTAAKKESTASGMTDERVDNYYNTHFNNPGYEPYKDKIKQAIRDESYRTSYIMEPDLRGKAAAAMQQVQIAHILRDEPVTPDPLQVKLTKSGVAKFIGLDKLKRGWDTDVKRGESLSLGTKELVVIDKDLPKWIPDKTDTQKAARSIIKDLQSNDCAITALSIAKTGTVYLGVALKDTISNFSEYDSSGKFIFDAEPIAGVVQVRIADHPSRAGDFSLDGRTEDYTSPDIEVNVKKSFNINEVVGEIREYAKWNKSRLFPEYKDVYSELVIEDDKQVTESVNDIYSYITDLAHRNKVDITGLSLSELAIGVKEEMEHAGKNGSDTGVIEDDLGALKIAVAHLREDGEYYSKLRGIGLVHESCHCNDAFESLGVKSGIRWTSYP